MDARLVITGVAGTREITITEFLNTLPNSLKPGEIVSEIVIPRPAANSIQKYIKFRMRESIDFALVSVASLISLENGICRNARIALGAVAPRPVNAVKAEKILIGRKLDEKLAAAAAKAAVEDALPLEKNSYKIAIAQEMVQRAIM
jgi:xanthine dehydrogenase YagS FAD-binding subunit